MRKIIIALALSAAIGALAGLYLPRGTEAASRMSMVLVHPGATAHLTCGWHQACVPPYGTSGHALDWRSAGGSTIYWRSFG